MDWTLAGGLAAGLLIVTVPPVGVSGAVFLLPTVREEEILRAIRHSIRDRGEALSVRQLAREHGLRSPASVAYHLVNLEERGALVRDGRSWQTCRLTG
ncbi:hypothetical protein OHU34_03360 [Streptomyces sp. NBC_00080]|uniref:LexA family protein n=1 Tax=Streptomyces sp. NBC_00080 TaxID=2975645 RepID=UPI003245D07D